MKNQQKFRSIQLNNPLSLLLLDYIWDLLLAPMIGWLKMKNTDFNSFAN